MLNQLDNFFLSQTEPNKSCFMALREIIIRFDTQITEQWKYKVPFYYFKGKPFCYLWQDNKTRQPYIGIVKGHLIDNPNLIKGNRKKMKVLMIEPNIDIVVKDIYDVFNLAQGFYKSKIQKHFK